MKLKSIIYPFASFGTVLSIYLINNYQSLPHYGWAILALSLTILLSVYLARQNNGSYSFKYKSVEPSEFLFFPVYIGLYLIALRLEWNIQSWIILTLLFIIWFRLESVCYFNIIWSLMGYKFYRVTTSNGTIVHVICKNKDWKISPSSTNENLEKVGELTAINNFTYIQNKFVDKTASNSEE